MRTGKPSRSAVFAGLYACLLLLALLSGQLLPYVRQVCVSAAPPSGAPAGPAETAAAVRLKEGDYLYFGRYRGEPILWRVIALEEGRPLLFSEYALCYKAFAASENPLDCSSAWQGSSLRQWLNSAEKRVPWAGAAPEAAHIYEGHNAYADEPGFLYEENFSSREFALLAAPHQGGDQVFLLSRKQLNTFSAAQRRKAFTPAALGQDDSPYLSLQRHWWYWTADPISTNTQSVCAVTGRGTFYKSLASDGRTGVCPALYLAGAAAAVTGQGSLAAPYQLAGGAA